MSLRWKLAIAMGLLLLSMVTLVSVGAYLTTDRRLHEEVDSSLDQRVDALIILIDVRTPRRPGPRLPEGARADNLLPSSASLAQLIDAQGRVIAVSGDVPLPVTQIDRRLAVNGGRRYLHTIEVDGRPYRVETVALPAGGALQVARDLQPTNDTLDSLRRRYAASSALVALLGAIVGWLLASWLTRPVARLTAAAEHVAATGQLDADIDVSSKDETGRLAQAFASMLTALRESRGRQRQLVQDASHELRTPVTSIRTNVDVLRRHPQLDAAERAKVLDDVNVELTHVTTMVQELVVLASGDGEVDDNVGPVQLDEVVAQAVERVRRRTAREVRVDAERTVVQGSGRGLERAVNNLLDNAVKFSPPASPIEVSLRNARVAVRDHGSGIAPEDLGHVFDRFYRATSARSAPGSGLGLAIVDQVAESHGGGVFAENAPGGGAVVGFWVTPSGPSPG